MPTCTSRGSTPVKPTGMSKGIFRAGGKATFRTERLSFSDWLRRRGSDADLCHRFRLERLQFGQLERLHGRRGRVRGRWLLAQALVDGGILRQRVHLRQPDDGVLVIEPQAFALPPLSLCQPFVKRLHASIYAATVFFLPPSAFILPHRSAASVASRACVSGCSGHQVPVGQALPVGNLVMSGVKL